MQHLVFVSAPVVAAMMSGRKIVESRLSKISHPARHVRPGDELLFKKIGGDVELYAMAERVDHYSDLRPADILALRELYSDYCDDIPGMNVARYWTHKVGSRYASFVWLTDFCALHIPKVELPSTRMGWIAGYPA